MNRVTIKQSRVADLLKSKGWRKPKKHVIELFLRYHDHIPGLVKKQTRHRPAKSGISTWYDYETSTRASVTQAEKQMANEFARILGLAK